MTNPHRRLIPTPTGEQFVRRAGRELGMGRHVNHDPRSRRYARRDATSTISLDAVFHERHIPIFDQGDLGSCTGNAALGILATGPYWEALPDAWQAYGPWPTGAPLGWGERAAVDLYGAITATDDITGQYPPEDTGSDGLSAAKVLTAAGIVPGYQHTFTAIDALAALQEFPLLVGTVWTDPMFEPDHLGRIKTSGGIAGGHEWIVDEYVPDGHPARTGAILSPSRPYIGGTTSWGESFGVAGRFYMLAADFATLLAEEGDVIVLTPSREAPPVPDPSATASYTELAEAVANLVDVFERWRTTKSA